MLDRFRIGRSDTIIKIFTGSLWRTSNRHELEFFGSRRNSHRDTRDRNLKKLDMWYKTALKTLKYKQRRKIALSVLIASLILGTARAAFRDNDSVIISITPIIKKPASVGFNEDFVHTIIVPKFGPYPRLVASSNFMMGVGQ